MNKFICVVGISGIGKSTYCAKLSESTGYPVVSSDTLRKKLTGSESDFSKDHEIWGLYIRHYLFRALVRGGVIFDATGVSKKSRKRIFSLAAEGGADLECHYFEPNIERAKRQNAGRARKIPELVIEEQAAAWQTPTVEEGFDRVFNIDKL